MMAELRKKFPLSERDIQSSGVTQEKTNTTKIGIQYRLSLIAGQMYCRMLQMTWGLQLPFFFIMTFCFVYFLVAA